MSRARTNVATGAARAVARLAKQVEVALAPLDLSLPQYRVLALLGDGFHRVVGAGPPPGGEPADRHRRWSTVSSAAGLVERRADPEDRRRLTLLPHPRRQAASLAAADAAAEARLDEIGGVPGRAHRRAHLRARALEPRARPQPRRTRAGAATGEGRDRRVRRRRHVAVRPRGRHAAVPAATGAHRSRPRRFVVAADHAGRPRAQVDVRVLVGRVVPRARGAGADPQRGRPGDRRAREDDRPDAGALRQRSSRCSPRSGSCSPTCRATTCCKTAYRIEYDLRNIIYEHLQPACRSRSTTGCSPAS